MANYPVAKKVPRHPKNGISTRIGMRVRVVDGKYAGHEGVIKQRNPAGAYVALEGCETPYGLPVFIWNREMRPDDEGGPGENGDE